MPGPGHSGNFTGFLLSFIVLFALSLTLASIMWIKALHHQWFSTMFGVNFFAGSLISGLITGLAALVAEVLAQQTQAPAEVIVVDNASIDTTGEVARDHGATVVIGDIDTEGGQAASEKSPAVHGHVELTSGSSIRAS